jgi:hypothetical protein
VREQDRASIKIVPLLGLSQAQEQSNGGGLTSAIRAAEMIVLDANIRVVPWKRV